MNRSAPRALGLLASLLFVGCSATGPVYARPTLPAEGDLGVVEIYRPDAFVVGGAGFRVFIDDRKVVTLWNNGYSRILVPAGQHTLEIPVFNPGIPFSLIFASDLTFQVNARERTCVRIEPGFFSASPSVDTSERIATARFETPERDRL